MELGISFLRKSAYIISLTKTCSIQFDTSTKIWKLADNVAALAKLWGTSFSCLRTNFYNNLRT
jgi:hypothetical protein